MGQACGQGSEVGREREREVGERREEGEVGTEEGRGQKGRERRREEEEGEKEEHAPGEERVRNLEARMRDTPRIRLA